MYYMSVSSENLNSVSIISNKSFISQSNLLPLLTTPTWFARIAIQGIPSDKSGTKSVILIATGSNGICFIGLSLLPLYGYRYHVEEKSFLSTFVITLRISAISLFSKAGDANLLRCAHKDSKEC